MRIKIDSLEALYHLLKKPPVDESLVSGDEWKIKPKETKTRRVAPFGFQYQSAELVFPLDDVTAIFKRFGESYSSIVVVDCIDKTVFNGTYETLSEALKQIGYKFIRKNSGEDDSAGQIFNGKGDCIFSISSGNRGFIRAVSMGTAGAHTRDIPASADRFIKEVGTLESLANVFIECLLKPFSEREDIKYLGDKVLYLNP